MSTRFPRSDSKIEVKEMPATPTTIKTQPCCAPENCPLLKMWLVFSNRQLSGQQQEKQIQFLSLTHSFSPRQKDREGSHQLLPSPNVHDDPEQGSKACSKEFNSGFPLGRQEPCDLSHHGCLLPRSVLARS